jgi:hypothetical protein
MSGLTNAQREGLRSLMSGLNDVRLGKVATAVGAMPGDTAEALQVVIGVELRERKRKLRVLGPLLPMFRVRRDAVQALTFPPVVLDRLWAVARSAEPELLARLDGGEAEAALVAERLGIAASNAVRDNPDDIWPDAYVEALENLTLCLDLLAVARRGVAGLEGWLKRPDEQQLASLRLVLRDAEEVSFEGPRALIDILFAHMDDAVLVLRLLPHVSGAAASASLMSGSEFGVFVDRLMAAMKARAGRINAFRPGRDMSGLEAVMADLDWCAAVLAEMDVVLDPEPHSEWGQVMRKTRQSVGGTLSNLIAASGAAVEAGLPMTRTPLAGRMTRRTPRLDVETTPGPDAAGPLLKFVAGLRRTAPVFGCEAERQRLVEALTVRLSDYADEALILVNSGEVEDKALALKQIKRAATWLTLIEAKDVARSVRRRVAVADGVAPADKASSDAA